MRHSLLFQLGAVILVLPLILSGCGPAPQQQTPNISTRSALNQTQTAIAATTESVRDAEQTQVESTKAAETQETEVPPAVKTLWAEAGVANGTEWAELLTGLMSAQSTNEAQTNEVAEICRQSKNSTPAGIEATGPLWRLVSQDSLANELLPVEIPISPILNAYIVLNESPIPEGQPGYAATLGQAKILACEFIEQEQEFAKECPYEGGYVMHVYRTNAIVALVDLQSKQTLAWTTLSGTTEVCPYQWTFIGGDDSMTGPPPADDAVMNWITAHWTP